MKYCVRSPLRTRSDWDWNGDGNPERNSVLGAFRSSFKFQTVKGTSGSVNYDINGQPTTQWYYFSFWNTYGIMGYDAKYREANINKYKGESQPAEIQAETSPIENCGE